MIEAPPIALDDQAVREQALDTTRSILVHAPAGSGKTELLAARFLKLLAEVEEPEQILAITFTVNATAEMRHRILAKLERAKLLKESGIAAQSEKPADLELAVAALANSARRGWRLLERPQRLNIQSIDSLCARIVAQKPLSAKLGATMQPTKVTWPLYRSAARKTFDRLGGSDAELNHALESLLLLRDSNLAGCETLLASMLATRDQWTRAFPLAGGIDWSEARARLEAPFQREIHRVLAEARALLSSHPEVTQELLRLANYACENSTLKIEIRLLAGLAELPLPTPEFLDRWRCLCDLLLTKSDHPRKSFNTNNGFPRQGKDQKARMIALVQALGDIPELMSLLCEIRGLPPPCYTQRQWEALGHILVALRHAVRELNTVFAGQNTVDFTEVGMAALRVLHGDPAAGYQGDGVRHMLVDEFQDTSRSQHELIAALLRNWSSDARRTFFLVGDPMQSIYMFRQADVELFNIVREHGFATGEKKLPAKTLRLTTNFRSNAGVVNPLNAMFDRVFPFRARTGAAAVDFLPGAPFNRNEPEGAYQVHASFRDALGKDKTQEVPSDSDHSAYRQDDAGSQETEEIVEIIRRHLPKIDRARARGEEFTVAVLARAKNHLASIAAALRDQGIRFRAVELEKLGNRQEVLDLRSLTRALLHPMDRIAWLAVLRAPWCGVALKDLHLLCGTDERQSDGGAVSRQIEERLSLLDAGPKSRVERLLSVLQAALRGRYRQSSFSSWIERAWHSLGGPVCVEEAGYENARSYFQMLDRVSLDGIEATGEAIENQLEQLFAAPDPSIGERCGVQLMTMHKAKGLGFNVVILPGLHRATRRYTPALVRYLERTAQAGVELLAAPIDSASEESSQLNRWVRRQKEEREAEERKRLLYVACTRARDELHLFATATVTNSKVKPGSGTLLETAWPALQQVFEAKHAEQIAHRAAQKAGGVLVFPSPDRQGAVQGVLASIAAGKAPTTLRKLPENWIGAAKRIHATHTATNENAGDAAASPGRPRSKAPRSSRLLGTIVHALFERAARQLERGGGLDDLRSSIPQFRRHAAALARGEGLTAGEVDSCASQAAAALLSALGDPQGIWILKPRPEAHTEASWTAVIDGTPQPLRVDRSFCAGPEPLTGDGDYLWIVDYKTATNVDSGLEAFIQAERALHKPQLERYGHMARLASGAEVKLRFAIYYPFLKLLDWWA